MEENNLEKYSDIDGISPATMNCAYCNLNYHEEFMIRKLCANCRRLFVLYQLNQMLSKLVVPSIFLGIVFYVIDAFKGYAFLPPVLVLGPAFAIGVFQQKIHFRGVEEKNRIIPLLRYSNKLNDSAYYNYAVELWKMYYENYTDIHRKKILSEFVTSILNRVKPSPMNWIEDLSNPTNLPVEEFIQSLFNFTEIREALSVSKGTGTLPDIWEHIVDDELKTEIMDILSANIEKMDEATDIEKKLFLEDLYLIEDDILELVESNPNWENLSDALGEFEAEVPPKNMFEEVKRNSQAQSEMQQLIKN